MRALIFDLDGTLVDTVYAHIFAWQQALAEGGMAIEGWRIHRKIGMSGGLFTRAVARELGREIKPEEEKSLQQRHGQAAGGNAIGGNGACTAGKTVCKRSGRTACLNKAVRQIQPRTRKQ